MELYLSPSLFSRTRQWGCPLSPLFALATEPLAAKLSDSPHMVRLRVGGIEERVSLYADDMLFYLQDPGASLSSAFQYRRLEINLDFVSIGPNHPYSPVVGSCGLPYSTVPII